MLPFVWMLSTSLKEPGAIFAYPPAWIPDPVVWANYPRALTTVPFATFFLNTCIVTGTALLGTLLSATLAAYSFSRLRWPGRDVLFFVVLTTLMLPHQVTLIPQFIIFRELGWIDTLAPLIVPWFFGGGPFNIFLLRQFFLTIPEELDDAARIDGCGLLGVYWRIVIPQATPALAAVAIFAFQARWNEFLTPLIYIHSRERFTLALGLRLFQEQYWVDWSGLMAASTVVMLPILVLFYFAQRYFIQGIVFTGVKG
ncbi:MAG: carbohydrate ABC transporter permease [Chloroflexi bacterium]|nr:carbohydrate ABC transporter permease [Chloroflexota bacterium]